MMTGERTRLLIHTMAAMTLVAVATAIGQAALPDIMQTFRLTNSEGGRLVSITSLGFVTSVLAAGMISDRIGKQPMLAAGSLVIAAGALGFAVSPTHPWADAAIFVVGVGAGTMEAAASALISDLYGDRRGFFLNISHAAFGIGALIGPLLMGYAIETGAGWRPVYLLATGAGVALFLIVLPRRAGYPRSSPDQVSAARLLRDPVLLLLIGALFLYVCGELGLAYWVTTYLQRDLHSGVLLAGAALSGFWGAMMVGRLLSAWVCERTGLEKFIIISAGAGALSVLAGLTFASAWTVFVFFMLTGFSISGIWPTIVARAGQQFPGQSGAAVGLVCAGGGMASVFSPWLIGWLSTDGWGLHRALHLNALFFAGVVALLGGAALVRRAGRNG